MATDKRTADFKSHVDGTRRLEAEALIKGLKNKLAVSVAQYKELQVAFETYKTANDYIAQLEDRFTIPKVIKPTSRSGKSESMAAAFAADWHAFETVLPEQVSGLNVYNPAICTASVHQFFKSVITFLDIHRQATVIDTLLLGFLGDLITSMIHDDQKEMNAGTPLEEALFVADLVIGGIDYLLTYSDCKKIIICTCDGNHSRITQKTQKANRSKKSLEWLMFHFIQRHYEQRKENRIQWNIAEGYHLYIDTEFGGDRTLRLHHGDQGIRYQGGVGGLAVPAQRAIKQWNIGRRADLDVFGHWHQSEFPRSYVCVGSIIGYNPYAVTIRAEAERPQQAMMIFEKKRWITGYHQLYVR